MQVQDKHKSCVVHYILIFLIYFTAIYYSLCIWDKESLSEIRIYAQKITIAQYVSDKRYKTGNRLSGYSEEDINIKVPCDQSERGSLIKVGFLYIILSLISLYLGTTIIKLSQEDSAMRKYTQFVERAQNEKDYIETVSNGDSVEYQKRMDEFNKKYQEAIEYIENHKK